MLIEIDGNAAGIRCDLTGEEMTEKFVYFSVTGRKIVVEGEKVLPKEVGFDLDVSEAAYKALIQHCMEHLGEPASTSSIRCDMTGETMSGNFSYWRLNFDKVLVDLSDESNPMETIPAVMDMNICQEAHDEMVSTQSRMRPA